MHTASFPINIYDVDVFGELRANVLLRFLWHAASQASAAIGFDLDWYARAGTLWIIRRTELELTAPAVYADELDIRTWVSDLRRVRSQRQYEIWRRRDAQLIGRALTDWVYVDLTRGALLQPPQALQQRLMPGGVVSRPRRPSAAAPPPAQAWRATRRVELADLDTVAHVNNAQYAVFVEQALWDALAGRGWTVDPNARAGRLRLRGHDLEYFDSAQYGDELGIAVWIAAVGAEGFTSQCLIERHGARSLHARSTWQWTDGALPGALTDAARALHSGDGA